MSLSNILGRSFNFFKAKPLFSLAVGKNLPLTYCAASSLGYHTNQRFPNEIFSAPTNVQVKLTDAVRNFSTTSPRLSADHSKLWVYERYVSAALLAIVPLGLMMPNILFDLMIAGLSVMHMHWGIEAIVVDYVRPIIFGNLIPKIAVLSVYLLSIFTLVGLLNLIFNNVGLANSIRHLWRINKEQK